MRILGFYKKLKKNNTKDGLTIHAEVDAIQNFVKRGKKVTPKHCIMVIQVNQNNGEIKMSKPCKNCQKAILEAGFKHIYYSDKNGDMIHEKLSNI